MKKALFALMLTLSALPALAQRYPHPGPGPGRGRWPGPGPGPGTGTCQVAAVDRYNRLIARFYGRTDWRTGMCREGLRNCNMEVQRRGWYDARCVEIRGY